MKVLKYRLMTEVNYGTEEQPDIQQTFSDVSLGWSEANEEIAKREAYNGEVTVEEIPDIETEPTAEQRVSDIEEQLIQADETAIALYEAQEAQEVINAQQDEALMEIYEMIG